MTALSLPQRADHLLAVVALGVLAVVCLWITVELWRRTRDWDGLSKGLTLLVGGLAVLLWWAVVVTFWDGPDTIRVRLVIELVLIAIGGYAIWQLRKLPPLPPGKSRHWHHERRS